MRRWFPLLLLSSLFALWGGSTARATPPRAGSDVVYESLGAGQGDWGPSQKTQSDFWGELDAEVADDFEMEGTITAVTAYGYNGHIGAPSNPPPFHGVFVRFYGAGVDGKPGALLKEYYRPAGDAGLWTDRAVPSTFRVTLDPPFEVAGRYFFSVQPVMDPEWQARWYWRGANVARPRGQLVYVRDNRAAQPEWTHEFGTGAANSDAAFQLHGTRILPPPSLVSLSATTLPQARRLKLEGDNFGITQGSAQVLIGGVAAPVSRWSDTAIMAYIPDEAGLGQREVRVITTGGSTPPATVNIVPRTSDGRVRWRFQADAYYLPYRAVTASDGSIYLTDLFGRLYALSPEGGVRWIHQGAIGTAAVAADGLVVTTNTQLITGLEPSGETRWQYALPSGTTIFAGPSLGPDGHLYAATASESGQLGALSLTTAGALRWSRDLAADRVTASAVELAFAGERFYFTARGGLYGVALGGEHFFTRPALGQPQASPDGTLWVTLGDGGLAQIGADGAVRRGFGATHGNQVIGPDGVAYVTRNYRYLTAFAPEAAEPLWEVSDQPVTSVFTPSVGPLNDTVLYTSQANLGESFWVNGLDVAGAALWRFELGMDNGAAIFPMGRMGFSPDGRTAYMGTSGNNYAPDTYAYFYAIDISGATDPGLSTNPTRVTGGHRTTGRVTLTDPAPPGGTLVQLSSADPSVAAVPATVTVRPGARSATFPVNAAPVAVETPVQLTASSGLQSYSTTVTVVPPVASGLTLFPSMVYGGETVDGAVTLSGPAPAGGWTVTLTSTNPAATVPATVVVPAGADAVSFQVTTAGVGDWTDLQIIASAGGQAVAADFTIFQTVVDFIDVDPGYGVGGEPMVGTVQLTGPAPAGGIMVKLVAEPAGLLTLPETVTVPEGQPSATFTIGTPEVLEYTSIDLWAVPLIPGQDPDDLSGATGTWIDLIPADADQVSIESARFSARQKKLTVQAKTSKTRAVLKAYNADNGKLLGKLQRSGRRWLANFSLRNAPKRIRVRSNLKGGATGTVLKLR